MPLVLSAIDAPKKTWPGLAENGIIFVFNPGGAMKGMDT
jgi:hypothetical protein